MYCIVLECLVNGPQERVNGENRSRRPQPTGRCNLFRTTSTWSARLANEQTGTLCGATLKNHGATRTPSPPRHRRRPTRGTRSLRAAGMRSRRLCRNTRRAGRRQASGARVDVLRKALRLAKGAWNRQRRRWRRQAAHPRRAHPPGRGLLVFSAISDGTKS